MDVMEKNKDFPIQGNSFHFIKRDDSLAHNSGILTAKWELWNEKYCFNSPIWEAMTKCCLIKC